MKNRSKILRIITSLDPKYGGPQSGILSSSQQLVNEGFDVDIIVNDKRKFVNFKQSNIKIINLKSFIGENYRFSLKLFFWLKKNRNNYSIIIIHGLWQFNTIVARLLLKNYFVFTHGQLDPYFKRDFYKMLKKKIYWYFFEKKNLIKSRSLLLTSKGEYKTLQNTFVNTDNIKKNIIRYGVLKNKLNRSKCIKKFYSKFPYLKNKDFYLFLGRFDEKKGCDLIIKSVNKSKNFKGCILMAGPSSGNGYKNYLKKLVFDYNLREKIFFSNAIYKEIKWGSILASKAMILASHGENFGVSIAESLSLGKPVLITDKVNIADDIKKFKAGLVSTNTIDSFKKKLNIFEKFNKKKLTVLSKNCINCFNENYDLNSNKKSLAKFLRSEQIKIETPTLPKNQFSPPEFLKKIIKLKNCIFNPQFFNSYINNVAPLFELETCLKEINNINTIIDIGSNKGQFSVMAKYYFPKCKIFSFEPQKKYLSIQKEILPKKNTYLFNIGLGNSVKKKNFFITSRNDSSSFLKPFKKISNDYEIEKIEKIQINKLDNIFKKQKLIGPVLIKIDVQGLELDVLKGAQKLLKDVDYIITEVSWKKFYKNQVTKKKLIKFLNDNNFNQISALNISKENNKTVWADILFKRA